MGRITYDQFCEAVWAAVLIPHACTDEHWQIIGGEFLVNFWPYSRRGSRFQAVGSQSDLGDLSEAIRAAHCPPVIAFRRRSFGLDHNREYRDQVKNRLLSRDPRCYWCGLELGRGIGDERWPTIDHRIPTSKGGTNSQDNLVLACLKCNRDKGNKMPQDYAKKRKPVPLW